MLAIAQSISLNLSFIGATSNSKSLASRSFACCLTASVCYDPCVRVASFNITLEEEPSTRSLCQLQTLPLYNRNDGTKKME